MLAIHFALNKFHQYTFGRHTTVISDHKPLQSITKKSPGQGTRAATKHVAASAEIRLHSQVLPRKKLAVADAMSRAYLKDTQCDSPAEELNVVCRQRIKPTTLETIKEQSPSDQLLQNLTINPERMVKREVESPGKNLSILQLL